MNPGLTGKLDPGINKRRLGSKKRIMLQTIIKRTLRIPMIISPEQGDGEVLARQLDIALLSVGFKLSKAALEYFVHLDPVCAIEQGQQILTAVKELVGDNVEHNVYFMNFPRGVPDTLDFWMATIIHRFISGTSWYGRYQHSYEEMLAHHDEFVSSAKDRITVLHLGKTLQEETLALYHLLAESAVPLNEADRALLSDLAVACLNDQQPEVIPVRENR